MMIRTMQSLEDYVTLLDALAHLEHTIRDWQCKTEPWAPVSEELAVAADHVHAAAQQAELLDVTAA